MYSDCKNVVDVLRARMTWVRPVLLESRVTPWFLYFIITLFVTLCGHVDIGNYFWKEGLVNA